MTIRTSLGFVDDEHTTYTRQQSRADKRAIFGELKALGCRDNVQTDRPTADMTRRDFLVMATSATAVAALVPLPMEHPLFYRYRSSGLHVPVVGTPWGGSGDWFEGRAARIAIMKAQEV